MREYVMSVVGAVVNVYTTALMIYALLSWFPGAYHSIIGRIIVGMVEPILRPLRRLGFQLGGFDFTIVLAIVLLNLVESVLLRLIWSM